MTMRMICGRILASVTVFLALCATGSVLGACDGGDDNGTDATDDVNEDGTEDIGDAGDTTFPAEEALTFSDQSVELSTVVHLESVTASEPRWVVISIASDTDEPTGLVVGTALVEPGSYSDVPVAFSTRLSDGERLVAQLYADAGVAGDFEPDGEDIPVEDVDPSAATITVPADTPAARILLDGSSPDYQVTMEPETFADEVDGLLDPDMSLRTSYRYEVVNSVASTHPWELINDSGEELLSQEDAGSLEGNADINWVDDGEGTSAFTATATLGTEVSEYRCSTHFDSMVGGVVVSPAN